jgi:type IV secretory pathway TrbD component
MFGGLACVGVCGIAGDRELNAGVDLWLCGVVCCTWRAEADPGACCVAGGSLSVEAARW